LLRLDLAIARRGGESSLIVINTGTGSFVSRDIAGSRGDHRKSVVADFDGDGTFIMTEIESEARRNEMYHRDAPTDGLGRRFRNEIHGLEDNVSRAISIRGFQLIANHALFRHVKINIQVQRTAKTLNQRDCTGVGRWQ